MPKLDITCGKYAQFGLKYSSNGIGVAVLQENQRLHLVLCIKKKLTSNLTELQRHSNAYATMDVNFNFIL